MATPHEKVNRIEELRSLIRLVRSTDKVTGQSIVKKLGHIVVLMLQLVAESRFLFEPLPEHDWVIFFDGSRSKPRPDEREYNFIDRVCRTNRGKNLLEILGPSEDNRILLVNVAKPFGTENKILSSCAFLFGVGGFFRMPWFVYNLVRGTVDTKSITRGIMIASLLLIENQKRLPHKGAILLTSITWTAEIARVAYATQDHKFSVVEVFHGAGSANMAPYFHWLHKVATAKISYVNVIAGLPRFEPLSSNLVTDGEGEVACNVRLWSTIDHSESLKISENLMSGGLVVFIGGASLDDRYCDSDYFAKELNMLSRLSKFGAPIFYCPHPQHSSAMLREMTRELFQHRVELTRMSTLEAILQSTLVIGGFSTSLFEAKLLGVEAFSYEELSDLFVDQLAALVHYDSDMEALESEVDREYRRMKNCPVRSSFATRKQLAAERFGLKLELAA